MTQHTRACQARDRPFPPRFVADVRRRHTAASANAPRVGGRGTAPPPYVGHSAQRTHALHPAHALDGAASATASDGPLCFNGEQHVQVRVAPQRLAGAAPEPRPVFWCRRRRAACKLVVADSRHNRLHQRRDGLWFSVVSAFGYGSTSLHNEQDRWTVFAHLCPSGFFLRKAVTTEGSCSYELGAPGCYSAGRAVTV
jgi:hypothetical protein